METRSTRVLALAVAVLSATSSAGCNPQTPSTSNRTKIFYLQKQGTQGYFLEEAKGARQKARELGVDLVVNDLGNDTGKTVEAVDAAIKAKAAGMIIVVPDPVVGPQIVDIAKRANVPLLASDDEICVTKPDPARCTADELVPRVGFSGTQMGAEVGKKAAELYRSNGWRPEETHLIAAWKTEVTVCTDRVMAARPMFKGRTGVDIPIIEVATDNTPDNAKQQVAAAITGVGAKHWIVWGCNDENVTGAVAALEDAGYGSGDIIGVGINGDLACKVWKTGKPTGVRATLWLNGAEIGALAVQSMYDKIKGRAALKPETFGTPTVVTSQTYQAAGLRCD